MTALGQIFAEVDRRLGVDQITGLQSYERMPSGDPARFNALVVYDEGDEPIEHEAGTTRNSLRITVEGYVIGHGGAATHDEMTKLHAQAVFALCGDAGTNLGGLVENIEVVGTRRVAVTTLAEKRRLGFAQDFEITFSTPRGNPSILN